MRRDILFWFNQVFIKMQWKAMQNQGKHNYDMKATS